eukprot:gene6791-7894_t
MVMKREPLAIVGVGCRFPGDISNMSDFWKVLSEGTDCLTAVPADRWNAEILAAKEYKLNNRIGGFLNNIDQFDGQFFGVSPKEAMQMDPQQRLILQVAIEAMEDAKISTQQLKGSNVGVFIGSSSTDYNRNMVPGEINQFTAPGSNPSFLSNRLSYFLDITGPSMTVNTACSSSLVAIHLGANSIWKDECRTAIVGGVNMIASPVQSYEYGEAGLLNTQPDGRCYAFDSRASGYVRAEGAGVIIIKNLSDAIRDKDDIHAVILNTMTNTNGQTPSGITAPRASHQEALLHRLLEGASVLPSDVGYFECHGTGTQMGDANEMEAIGKSIGAYRDTPLPLGSVKTNVGHLEGASGICGVIKSIACIRNQKIAPICPVGFAEKNGKIPFDAMNLSVSTSICDWYSDVRNAIVNSFGVGGSNANIMLSNFRASMIKPLSPLSIVGESKPTTPVTPHQHAFTVSVNQSDAESLRIRVADIANHIQSIDTANITLGDLCHTSTVRTNHHTNRVVFMADSIQDLQAKLEEFLGDEPVSNPDIIQSAPAEHMRLGFVCSGQGQQSANMARELFTHSATFRAKFTKCSSLLQGIAGWSLMDKLYDAKDEESIHDTWLAQPAIFATQVSTAAVLAEAGIAPSALVGHSLGELSAAYLAGVLSLDDSIKLLSIRSALQNKTTGTGKMAVAVTGRDNMIQAIESAGFSDNISIAGNNSSKSVGITGDNDSMDAFMEILKDQGITVKPIRINAGFHSHLMDSIKDEFYRSFPAITHRPPVVPFYSTTLGHLVDSNNYGRVLNIDYWWRNLRESVLFKEAFTELIGHELVDGFVELSAHPILSFFVNQMVRERESSHYILPVMSRDEHNLDTMLAMLARLYAAGHDVRWEAIYPRRDYTTVRLPPRRWCMERFWVEAPQLLMDRLALPRASSLTRRLVSLAPSFEIRLNSPRFHYLADHIIQGIALFPGAAFIELVYAAMDDMSHTKATFTVGDLEIREALEIDPKFNNTLQINFDSSLTSFEIGSMIETLPHQRWTVHASGKILALGGQTPIKKVSVPVMTGATESAAFYSRISNLGYGYGPSFRALSKCKIIDERTSIAELRLPATEDLTNHNNGDFAFMHPSVLDGVFQAVFAPLVGDKQGLWIPQVVGRMTVHNVPADIRAPVIAHTTIVSHKDVHTFNCTISMTTANGEPIADITDMSMRCIARPPPSTVAAPTSLFWRHEWQESSEGDVKPVTLDGTIILTSDETAPFTRQLIAKMIKMRQDATKMYIVKQSSIGSSTVFTPGFGHIVTVPFSSFGSLFKQLHTAKSWSIIVTPDFLSQVPTHGYDVALEVENTYASLLAFLQLTVASDLPSPRMWLVSKGGQALPNDADVDLSHYSLIGLIRTFCVEHGDQVEVSMVDVEGRAHSADADLLLSEMSRHNTRWEVAFRDGHRHVYSLCEAPLAPTPTSAHGDKSSRRFQVELGNQGVISDLTFVETARATPSAGQIEVKVNVTSLNFRDVLKSLGRDYDAARLSTMGDEFSGVVTAVGEGVSHLNVGDRVFGIHMARAMASFITCDADLVFPLPSGMSESAACTLPIAYLTAWHSLITTARLSAGERVLIHSAAGGVGLAALNISLAIGAEVFVTVGTEDKRAHMAALGIPATHVFNSRSLEFSAAINRATNGTGVNVVLNSLSGDYIAASIACLAPYGRFVEIGKKDIYADSKLGLLPFRNNLCYMAVDIAQMTENRVALLAELMNETLLPLFTAGTLPALPLAEFPVSRLVQAIRHMSAGTHIGKNVVTWSDLESTPTTDLALQMVPTATYLITGLGGLAMSLGNQLASLNARHLVFVSRTGSADPTFLAGLAARGVEVHIELCDLADETSVAALLARCAESYPAIRGIFHTAGALADRRLMDQDMPSFRTAFSSKAAAALNLHNLTLDIDLDHFVTFGSVTVVLGNPGQCNYAVANRFVEALTMHRHKNGLAATCLHLAPIPEVGMSADAAIAFGLRSMGFIPYASLASMSAGIVRCLSSNEPVVTFSEIDFSAWMAAVPNFRGRDSFIANSVSGVKPISSVESTHVAVESVEAIEQGVKEIVSNIMEIKMANINTKATFKELGLDSLLASELSNSIHKRFNVMVPSLALLDKKANIASIVAKISPAISASTSKRAADEDALIRETIQSIVNHDKRTGKLAVPTAVTALAAKMGGGNDNQPSVTINIQTDAPRIAIAQPLPKPFLSPMPEIRLPKSMTTTTTTTTTSTTPSSSETTPVASPLQTSQRSPMLFAKKDQIQLSPIPTSPLMFAKKDPIPTSPLMSVKKDPIQLAPIPTSPLMFAKKDQIQLAPIPTIPISIPRISPRVNPPTPVVPAPVEKPVIAPVAAIPTATSESDNDLVTVVYGVEPVSAPFYAPQTRVHDMYKPHVDEESNFLSKVYENCKIRERYFFHDMQDISMNARSSAEKNTMFMELVKKTVVEAGERVITRSGIDRSLISHVVGVTSTGVIAPSIDGTLIRELGLPNKAGRTMVNFMGCGAAVIALRAAYGQARIRPGTYVLLVAVESSSTNMDIKTHLRSDLVSSAIFSDGCVAALISTQPRHAVRGHLQIVDDLSFLMNDSEDALFMHMGNQGIDLTLKPKLSSAIAENINPAISEFLGNHKLTIADMEFWAVHPGGRKILEAVHEGLELHPEDLSESYEVMKWYGNMVSCSALFVLKRILEKIKHLKSEGSRGLQTGMIMAFSPGASIEAMLLKIVQ